jgi:hypothetical protein
MSAFEVLTDLVRLGSAVAMASTRACGAMGFCFGWLTDNDQG